MSILDFFKKDNAEQTNSRPLYTPEHITSLQSDEIFVFGSNLGGHHGGGAARVALNKFGATYGQGIGLQGQSYAIPTMQGGVETIKPYVDDFVGFAKQNQHLFFYVTRIGCGIAGFQDEEIAPLFADSLRLNNVCLPKSFVDILQKLGVPDSFKNREYGQVRTLADIAKFLNEKNNYTDLSSLLADFKKVLDKYIERGTISRDTHELVVSVLKNDKTIRLENDSQLYSLLTNAKNFEDKLEEIYYRRSITKLIRIIEYFNRRRRYQSSDEVIADLTILMNEKYKVLNDSYHYPLFFFQRGLEKFWNEITIDGVMDNNLLDKLMFEQHDEKVKKYGLNKVIEMDFQDDGPCHPEVFFPKKIGTAAVYVGDSCSATTIGSCTANPTTIYQNYIKSCGEGKGPRREPYYYEEELLRIVEDKRPRC